MKEKLSFIMTSMVLLFLICLIENNRIKSVYMSEINEEMNYVEIYNPSNYKIDLTGYSFSDNFELFGDDKIEDAIIEPHSYYVHYLDKFGLSSSETIYFINDKGYLIDKVQVPNNLEGKSFCFINNSWVVSTPSPLEANQINKKISKPVFSKETGFYDNSFYLTITSKENNKIFYTTDGSCPSELSKKYEDLIYVYDKSPEPNVYRNIKNTTKDWLEKDFETVLTDKAFVIRAICIDENGNKSEETYATYFVGLDKYKNKNIISLIANPDDLFGSNGIYVTGEKYDDWCINGKKGKKIKPNFQLSGKEHEVETCFQFISKNNSFSQKAGLRIHGASNRDNNLKSFSIYSREYYGENYNLKKTIFDNFASHSLIINNDFSDALLPLLVEDRDIAVQKNIDTTVFINGEHWYDTFTCEKFNKTYLSEHYMVDEDNIIIIKNENLYKGKNSESDIYNDFIKYIDSKNPAKEKDYSDICKKIDIQSYIDYFCSNVYFCNMDLSENKNCFLWKTRKTDGEGYSDGKWRFMLYDVDCIDWVDPKRFGVDYTYQINSLSSKGDFVNNSMNETKIYKKLSKNKMFIKDLVITFMDLINYNFDYDRINAILSQYKYIDYVDYYDEFFKNRPSYMIEYLKEEYNLSNNIYNVAIKNPCSIKLNTLKIKEDFNGKYFGDYPISLSVDNNDGMKFIGWNIDGKMYSSDSSIEIVLTHDIEIEPVWDVIND